ncbi:hypothetical protein [Dactylosporangium matsuzakiense]|uniref:Leucine rich repeat (LRR) protein n=1 Tax=Dactylosporangium matsuzakiense TaxID=53360 RepID=A0A9W6KHT4_9ACTN|nr:hypothetical protein [Dactylosporangium matsuzakiense]UWZ46804.1 hypothetical protein Dmats_10535 [Dactylosporangium matsuzakiense]GLL01778.1 hypothetical protein GCM10017581_035200 [Dactylosporangium matsuzakiense]
MTILDELRADGSWRMTWSGERLERAVFRLNPDTAADRGALVQRLGADAADAQQWESALIEALLGDPAAGALRSLELHLTDFHHSARRAAEALVATAHEQLAVLYFGHDFRYLFEHQRTSTGATFDPLDRLHKGFVGDAANGLWEALPGLRELTAEGGLLFDDIDSDSLTELRLRGALLADGAVFPTRAPNLATLRLEIGPDVFGTACPPEQLEELTPAGFPRLRHLDLGRSEFDATDLDVLRTLAEAPILPQLETLRIAGLRVEAWTAGGDPIGALRGLAPAFAHLALSVAGPVAVEGTTAAVLPIVTG